MENCNFYIEKTWKMPGILYCLNIGNTVKPKTPETITYFNMFAGINNTYKLS